MKDVLTTGQAAKICRVSPRTIVKWYGEGELKGYRLGPGGKSGDRRILLESLIESCQARGIPLEELEDEARVKVLIVCQDRELIENLERKMPEELSFKVTTASNAFKAGMEIEKSQPDCIIIDSSIGLDDAMQIGQGIRITLGLNETILIALLPDDDSFRIDRSSINETFKKPFDPALVAERIRTLIGAKKELSY